MGGVLVAVVTVTVTVVVVVVLRVSVSGTMSQSVCDWVRQREREQIESIMIHSTNRLGCSGNRYAVNVTRSESKIHSESLFLRVFVRS